MYRKIYMGAWAVYFSAIALLAIFGMLTGLSVTILGMAAFGLIYFGMMLVLPLSIKHPGEATDGKGVTRQRTTVLGGLIKSWNPTDTSVGKVSVAHHSR